MVNMLKVKVLKPTLCQDENGQACIAPTGRIVMLREGKARHFINTGIVKLAAAKDKLSVLEPYKAAAPEKAKNEAAEVGMAVAKAIADLTNQNVNEKVKPKEAQPEEPSEAAKAVKASGRTPKEKPKEAQPEEPSKAVKASGRTPKETVFIDQDPNA